jgi:mRNA interferase MazF
VRRGELWTAAGSGYAGKPRPVLIVQTDLIDTIDSVTICLLTTDSTQAPLIRIVVDPSEQNGLRQPSRLMVDKLMTTRRGQLRDRVGVLEREHMLELERSLVVFLGLA